MRLVDSSTPYGIAATALRPYKEALPIVEVGDVVLLREFKVSYGNPGLASYFYFIFICVSLALDY